MSDAWYGLEPCVRLALVRLGTAGDIQFHFAQSLVRVINERPIHFNRFAHAGIGKVLCDSLAIGFVGQLFPDLRQIVLTIGIVNVGSEFGAFLYQMTAPPE